MPGDAATFKYPFRRLSYHDACHLAVRLRRHHPGRLILLDLANTCHTTTAALARLVALRRDLLKVGRDLWIVGLSGQAHHLYELTLMRHLLPRRGATCVTDGEKVA